MFVYHCNITIIDIRVAKKSAEPIITNMLEQICDEFNYGPYVIRVTQENYMEHVYWYAPDYIIQILCIHLM